VIGKMQKCSKISLIIIKEKKNTRAREEEKERTKIQNAEQNFSVCAREEHASRDERESLVCLPF